ncbi:hypothetical protein BKA57DRAFT_522352 [Linnemannia elongata]|nr:hypothetical protein BKA57DRAFT_522352 [Linnemannia elongata]
MGAGRRHKGHVLLETRVAYRRHRKEKVVSLPRESVGHCCMARIFMAQPVGEEDKVVVRYMWKHNHDDERAQLLLARNEREWVRRMVDQGHDWCSLSNGGGAPMLFQRSCVWQSIPSTPIMFDKRTTDDHLDGDRNLRIDRLVYILQDRVDREFRFAYLKTKRGFQPIPWRKGDDEGKQKADKVSFDEAQRKIEYNSGQPCNDGRLRISIQSFDPDTPDTYYILVFVARSGQLLSCSCLDFTKRKPLPCEHLFLAERVFHDLWLSRFLRPSVSADAIEARTDDHNDGLNDSDNANDDTNNNMDSNTDIFEQDSLRDQLALLSPQVYTQLEYERARRVKEERHRRKKQRKRDFEDVEKELLTMGA